jgi:hypothetical protein
MSRLEFQSVKTSLFNEVITVLSHVIEPHKDIDG